MLERPRPSLGVCYYPEQWPEEKWEGDLSDMHDAGIRYVRIGEFAWSRLEPAPGAYQFGWMKQVLDLANVKGLSIVLGTPSATPPKWLVEQMPDMLAVDAHGRQRKFGSRRHYCFSHSAYRNECARIIQKLAEEFGAHPAVAAWQTDNEYGCHDTTLSYSNAALIAFRAWLRQKYGTIAALNKRWGNAFWSLEYREFDEVDLPNLTVTEPNPSHQLDFRRFSSDQVTAFNRVQTDIIRRFSPGRPILHNFMGGSLDFDHFSLARDLDIAGWDSYPLGFLSRLPVLAQQKTRYLRAGDPDFCAFHHDLYRGCCRGRWWIMEQQPGPVNWAQYNPAPHPGMVRLWSLEAFAHGAEVVSYFRWRQALFAQEQMHAGLNRPDGTPDIGLSEVRQVATELEQLSSFELEQAPVALIFDYEAAWTLEIQPHTEEYDYLEVALSFYQALRRIGLNVDVIPQESSLDGYKLVVIPSLPILDPSLLKRLKDFGGEILIAPRTGSKTEDFQIPFNLPPGPLQELIPIKVQRVESLPSFAPERLTWKSSGYEVGLWFEHVETEIEPFIALPSGQGVAFRMATYTYLAALPSQELLDAIVAELADEAQLDMVQLPEGVRTRRSRNIQFFFNYNPEPATLHLPADTKFLLGSRDMPVAGVTVVQRTRA
jgi:beta-galactosidase